ncbi:MAG: UDP-N-acetylmuramoyl-tripeptide--D-alanyl-D-alanine ligase [Chloroflexota bacterium]
MRPVISTSVSHQTLWAVLGTERIIEGVPEQVSSLPPITLAVLDSRDVQARAIFVAFPGENTDGHQYIQAAIEAGAHTILCEERGMAMAEASGATLVDFRSTPTVDLPTRISEPPLAYIVDDALAALHALAHWHRIHATHPELRVIGITGSVGKSSTKELTASVLRQHYRTLNNEGSLNSEQGLAFTLLGLDQTDERAILEMGMYLVGDIQELCALGHPHVGVVTNVQPVHLSRAGTIERIAEGKSELVQALPSVADGGVAILNWDDFRVRAMGKQTEAGVFYYSADTKAGLANEDIDLWASDIEGKGLEGVGFRLNYRNRATNIIEDCAIQLPLIGRHNVQTALCAAAVGLVEGLSWTQIRTGLEQNPKQIRLIPTAGIHGCLVIDDTYNASTLSTTAALKFLADVEPAHSGRRVAILGDMREMGSHTVEGHRIVGRCAAEVVDVLVTVGELGRLIGESAQQTGIASQSLYMMNDDQQAIALLKERLQPNDIALVKGSRAVGMEDIVKQITR